MRIGFSNQNPAIFVALHGGDGLEVDSFFNSPCDEATAQGTSGIAFEAEAFTGPFEGFPNIANLQNLFMGVDGPCHREAVQ